jgi:hypothetical protein
MAKNSVKKIMALISKSIINKVTNANKNVNAVPNNECSEKS